MPHDTCVRSIDVRSSTAADKCTGGYRKSLRRRVRSVKSGAGSLWHRLLLTGPVGRGRLRLLWLDLRQPVVEGGRHETAGAAAEGQPQRCRVLVAAGDDERGHLSLPVSDGRGSPRMAAAGCGWLLNGCDYLKDLESWSRLIPTSAACSLGPVLARHQ